MRVSVICIVDAVAMGLGAWAASLAIRINGAPLTRH